MPFAASFSTPSRRSCSATIAYRRYTDSVLWPVSCIATERETPARSRFRTAVRLKSCGMRPRELRPHHDLHAPHLRELANARVHLYLLRIVEVDTGASPVARLTLVKVLRVGLKERESKSARDGRLSGVTGCRELHRVLAWLPEALGSAARSAWL